MLLGKIIAVVVPAYNEETQIGIVIETMPDFVDRIIVINDNSKDRTAEIVQNYIISERDKNNFQLNINKVEIPKENFFNRADILLMQIRQNQEMHYPHYKIFNDNNNDRIILINHLKNYKVGGAIKTGYKWCRDHGIHCTAVMAGDAQMDPSELESICIPVVEKGIDYVKGNRLSHKAAQYMIPRKRYFGNSVLSAMTKIASGYWRISDTQTGYTAISLNALNMLDIHKIYNTYGVPNDILIKLNIEHCSLREVRIKPVYNIGEKSKMKIFKVIPTVSLLLLKGFFKRIFLKYFLKDFHPIFIFFLSSFISFGINIYFLIYILCGLPYHTVSFGTYSGYVVTLISFIMLFGFGMWFDVIENDTLQK
jgi:glycosyltransferase involved in cell wall biosynthesis